MGRIIGGEVIYMKVDLERYLQELETIVNMDSGQGNPEGITAVGDFFADRFEKMGWIVEKYDLRPNTGNCTVIKNREADHYDVLLIGHVDTVFACRQTGAALDRRGPHRQTPDCGRRHRLPLQRRPRPPDPERQAGRRRHV